MNNLVRRNILGVSAYVAGKPIEETKRQLGLREVIKLASNENPLGPSPRAVSAIKKAAGWVNRYPDSQGFYLKRRLARHYSLGAENIILGNGSDELIDIIIKTFVEDDQRILTSEGTFLEYKIIASVLGRGVDTVPLKYFKYDLEAMLRKIDKRTKLIFIANPNNPTGTYITKIELEYFLARIPDSVIVVVDEAYDAFIDVRDFPSASGYLRNKNVIILKTFSKAYGLAGLRIGLALARPGFIEYMERARQPFNVNSLAQAAAIAALDDKPFLARTRKATLEGRQYLYGALKRLGITYVASQANFILLNTGCDGVTVFKDMLKMGVIVRDMQQYGLKEYIRVTVGTKSENEKFIKALKRAI